MKRKEEIAAGSHIINETAVMYNTNPSINPVYQVSNKRLNSTIYREIENLVVKFLHSLEQKDNSELQKVAFRLEKAVNQPKASDSERKLASLLTEGRSYTADEKFALETSAHLREFEHRRSVLEGALSTSQVAELLHTSRQTPHDRVKSGSLLAVRENGKLVFPAWQFDVTGPNGVLPGLPSVLASLNQNDFLKASWFIHPNRSLEGCTPAQALKAGDLEKVLIEARAVGAH